MMPVNQEQFAELLQQYINNQLSEQEEERLFSFVQSDDYQPMLQQLIDAQFSETELAGPSINKARLVQMQEYILASGRAKQIHLPKARRWWRYAAAAVIMIAIGSGLYYFNNQSYQSHKSSQITVQTKEPQQQILPGSNKAIWILTDGKQIELDSTVLDMTAKKNQSENIGYNELRTPHGGQYQLILPDGSKVWLNAASSIKYPVAFKGKERRVEVTGEAYFEIEKDAAKPFKVTGGGQEIEVLGTSFNINIYNDEPVKKTTLITGSIKITSNNQTAILQPGQQANLTIIPITKIKQITVQTNDIIAWKSGFFNFNNTALEDVMRQLARWYDLTIIYEKQIPNIYFDGNMTMDLPLADVLKALQGSGVHFRMEPERRLIVMP